MNKDPFRLFCYKGRTRNNLVGRYLEIPVMPNLAWLEGWPVKCQGWGGKRMQ